MNIAFCDGMFLQLDLSTSSPTIVSKQGIGTATIDFYNYFAKYRPPPEKTLLELSNYPADEAVKIISEQPLVNQFFSDYIGACQESNQAAAKETLAYTCNLVQRAFSDLVSALTVNTDARGLESNQTLFGGNQFTIAFALLDSCIAAKHAKIKAFERTTRKTYTTPNTDTCSSTITGNSTICVDIWRIHRHKRKSYKMSITPGTDGHALNMSR